MTAPTGHLELPLIGTGVVLRVEKSQYGDYFDFELRAVPPAAAEGAIRADSASVAVVSGYASIIKLVETGRGVSPASAAILIVGNTSIFLPLEHCHALAKFLGVDLEKNQPKENDDE